LEHNHGVALFEHDPPGATLVTTMRKPFDIIAEGPVSEKSRGDWTPLELFMPGIHGFGGRVAAILRQVAG
jgi:hypothetical protein